MAQAFEVSPTFADPLVRSDSYKMLSLVFKYPTAEIFQAYRNGEFMAAVMENLSELPHGKGIVETETGLPAAVRKELEGMSQIDLEVKFNQVFEVGAPEPPCPPYEGIYRKGVERTGIMIEVAEFYKQFGLKMSTEEGRRELPDHILAELEFLHFLAFKEAQARKENTPDLLKGYIHAQKDFLERHMVNWIPEFSGKLQNSGSLEFFTGMGRVLSRFIAAEYEYVKALFEQFNGGKKEPAGEVSGSS